MRHCAMFAVLAAFCALCGCRTTSTIETGLAHPSLEIVGSGVKLHGRYVRPEDVPEILEEHGVKHDTVVHIRLYEFDRMHEAQAFRRLLAHHGYKRTALVTKEHAEAIVPGQQPPSPPPARDVAPPARLRKQVRGKALPPSMQKPLR